MTKLLSQLLSAKEPLFGLSLQQLESASGQKSVDVRLQADILKRAHAAMRGLNLDHQDTMGPELFAALVSKIKEHDDHLAGEIGGSADESPTDLIPKIKAAAEKPKMNRSCWVLKKSVAKEFLRRTPPKQIMKHLGYRSIDSMLKKENLLEIYGALRFAEDSQWLEEFNEEYKSLKPSDFETRDIEILYIRKNTTLLILRNWELS